MRTPSSDVAVHSERAGRIDPIDTPRYRESLPGPSYVQSVLFGKRRTRSTPAAPGGAMRGAPEQERN
jgi:hypothetical protein